MHFQVLAAVAMWLAAAVSGWQVNTIQLILGVCNHLPGVAARVPPGTHDTMYTV
jgi:hypothetical protein